MSLGLFGVMPAFAGEHEGMKMGSHEGMKMETSTGTRECALQAESIQEKIKRLDAEVAKGTKKYSAGEIKQLQDKLREANDILDNLGKH